MSKADETHFQQYKQQTRVKHIILTRYLPVFLRILGANNRRLVFFDGFAGAGMYKNELGDEAFPGSPVLAIRLIGSNKMFAKAVQCIFVESRKEHFESLKKHVDNEAAKYPMLLKPLLFHGNFSDAVGELSGELKKRGNQLAPTFLFVDPCGVEGVSLQSIADILSHSGCEVLIFFNLDGVRRIAGLDRERLGSTLRELYGGQDRVEGVLRLFSESDSVESREQILVGEYLGALRAAGATYVLPFRVEAEKSRKTSHYLIHATKHPLGFKIMKCVMWEAGKVSGDAEGRLELLQASTGDISCLMRADLRELDRAVLEHLKRGPVRVGVFREDWVKRPEDLFTDGCYRRRLLEMESKGLIEVLDEDRTTVLPVDKRKRTKAGPSLANRLYVRLRNGSR